MMMIDFSVAFLCENDVSVEISGKSLKCSMLIGIKDNHHSNMGIG